MIEIGSRVWVRPDGFGVVKTATRAVVTALYTADDGESVAEVEITLRGSLQNLIVPLCEITL